MPSKGAHHSRVVIAASLGGALEMYDFVIYAFLAPILALLFFPMVDRLMALLAPFGVFALGYFARPLGGILYGHIGNRFGRKAALATTITLMAVASFLIGLLPTYHQH